MKNDYSAPWHKESYKKFLNQTLPALLSKRLPMAGYQVEYGEQHTCILKVWVAQVGKEIMVQYSRIPVPDDDGIFHISSKALVVIPVAENEHLDKCEIQCVGEQFYDFIEKRLGQAPEGLEWDEALIRSWLPLNEWSNEFFQIAQVLDSTNWLSACCHLRRILIKNPKAVSAPGQVGRTCPFEMPEGPNIAGVRSVAVGACIQDDKLNIIDNNPESALGVTAMMVPFLEHNDANRQLMGVNMMRQWQVPLESEPALVQTGFEPSEPDFWCGTNLLTAFISLGADTYEDAIILSESAAKKFKFKHPIEPGDKISNRHGTKGVISRILPDAEMPQMPDGRAVDLIFNFIGCHTRQNFGQIREGVMANIALAEGTPAIVPPFHAPSNDDIRKRFTKAGLPESGMFVLTAGHTGKPLERPSTVGYVYWGRTAQDVHGKIHASASPASDLQTVGDSEYSVLRDIKAFKTIGEFFNTCSSLSDNAKALADKVRSGAVNYAGTATPAFKALTQRLHAAGINAELKDGKVTFSFSKSGKQTIKLSKPAKHPWLPDKELPEIVVLENAPTFRAIEDANSKMERLLKSFAPNGLILKAFQQLEKCVREHFSWLLRPEDVRLSSIPPEAMTSQKNSGERISGVLFSGRSVIAPGAKLRTDQIGLPEQIAWELFEPFVSREMKTLSSLNKHDERALKILDEIMLRSWVILNNHLTVMPTNLIAFHPVRIPEKVIRINPLICMPMNADFDGDQAAVFLPITEAAQKEAGDLLSIAGHLRRDASLIKWLCPSQDALWGLANISLASDGRREIAEVLGDDCTFPGGILTRSALTSAMARILEYEGIEKTTSKLEHLLTIGLDAAKTSGASIDPFVGESIALPPVPEGVDIEQWDAYTEQVLEAISAMSDYTDNDAGPQLLAVKIGARGSIQHIRNLIASRGIMTDASGNPVAIRNGFNIGLSSEELFSHAIAAREALGQLVKNMDSRIRDAYGVKAPGITQGFNVLARAMRSAQPGIVFAHAATIGEVDPLTDIDSRLFVGLPIEK